MFLKDNLRPQGVFVGLDNYKFLFQDDVFRQVIWNNLIFALGTVPTSMALAILIAVKLSGQQRINMWMRTAFFYPTVIPLIAVANIWLFIYQPYYGLMTRLFDTLGLPTIPWLTSVHWVMASMVLMTVWKQTGFFMIFFLAGLQNIPRHIYESADMEGASGWYIFRRLTFPLLMPTTLFVLIIAITDSVKMVDHIFVMTEGGPNNASNLILYYIYQNMFAFGDIGLASTASVVLIVFLLLIAALNFFALDRRIHYR
ncbi:MAG: ABC transporter permease [Paenibacillus sp. RIFOXYA1_FULL_44_5]|nr:MAG: ABC transporter permease [Paenibacillus sp. RIFOXYA1_FULL_44_5]